MRKILILGATSAIAQATARNFATDGDALCLVGRNTDKLAAVAADLQVRGAAHVETLVADLNDCEQHEHLLRQATASLGGLDIALIAYGTLGNQQAGEQSYAQAEQELRTNFLSVVSVLTLLANQCETQQHGCLAVISSVAGERGRQSNYIYGTAKGGLNLFLQGLRNRLTQAGVTVLTIKPGFVHTPMTAAFPKNALFASAETVGAGVYRAIMKKKDIAYVPGFWRWIMLIIRLIPERVFKRLALSFPAYFLL